MLPKTGKSFQLQPSLKYQAFKYWHSLKIQWDRRRLRSRPKACLISQPFSTIWAKIHRRWSNMTQYSDWFWKKYFVEIHSWSVISTSNQKISKVQGAPSSSSKWQKTYHSFQWSTRARYSACCEDTEHKRWLAKANKSTKKWSNIKTSSKTKYKESRQKMTTRDCYKSTVTSKINTTHL